MNDQQSNRAFTRVVALAGGVGGAKLAAGLQAILPAGTLTIVVNTADDFRLWGLHISPDIDTVMYTLTGLANPETGWGLEGDTWKSLEMLGRYKRDTWFRLGDMDLATHILRTQMLHEGRTLTEATADLASSLNIPSRILPMSDQTVETLVETPEGTLDFQDYFVRRRHADKVTGVVFRGADTAHPTSEVMEAIEQADVIVFCPSNPIVSIGPILAVLGMRESLERSSAVRVAVSPIVGGQAIKGPAAHMLESLGHEVSAVGVASIYKALLDGMIIDNLDANLASRIEETGIAVHVTNTIMKDDEGRAALAEQTLNFGIALAKGPRVKTVAVVPVKSLREGKSRLASALSPEERAALTLTMLDHVLSTIRESGVISSIGIISPNSRELRLPGDIAVIEQTRSGLNNHLEEGREWAISNGADALMIIFSDLPLLTPGDIKAITKMGKSKGTVVLAPDRHGGGTNIMLTHPASLSTFAFGQGSYQKHRTQALAEGCRIETYTSEGTSLDIDTPDDLSFWHTASDQR